MSELDYFLARNLVERGGVWTINRDETFNLHPRSLLTPFEKQYIKSRRDEMFIAVYTVLYLDDVDAGRNICTLCRAEGSARQFNGTWLCADCLLEIAETG